MLALQAAGAQVVAVSRTREDLDSLVREVGTVSRGEEAVPVLTRSVLLIGIGCRVATHGTPSQAGGPVQLVEGP